MTHTQTLIAVKDACTAALLDGDGKVRPGLSQARVAGLVAKVNEARDGLGLPMLRIQGGAD